MTFLELPLMLFTRHLLGNVVKVGFGVWGTLGLHFPFILKLIEDDCGELPPHPIQWQNVEEISAEICRHGRQAREDDRKGFLILSHFRW